jgi:SAM-dependent methyltransferase
MPFQGPAGNSFDKHKVAGVQGWMVERFTRCQMGLVDEIPVTTLLDIGCGDGKLTAHIVDRNPGLSAIAVDDDDPSLSASWQQLSGPRLNFQVADAYHLPFPDNSFGMVSAFEVLEHLEDPHRALREIRRVCRGWLVATVPREPWWRMGNVANRRYVRQLGNTPGHVQHWTRSGFRRLLEPHGRVDELRGSTMWSLARVRLNDHVEAPTEP